MKRSEQPAPQGSEPNPDVPIEAPQPPGAPADEPAVRDMTELEAEAQARGINDLEGSGSTGNVIRADLVEAVTETPVPPVGRPPLLQIAEQSAAAVVPADPADPLKEG